jgi:hypothetical protein
MAEKITAENVKASKAFQFARKKAKDVAGDDRKLGNLLDATLGKLEDVTGNSEKIETFVGQVQTLMRMIGAYRRGDYRGINVKSVIIVVAALLYFIMPIDFIPEYYAHRDHVGFVGYPRKQGYYLGGIPAPAFRDNEPGPWLTYARYYLAYFIAQAYGLVQAIHPPFVQPGIFSQKLALIRAGHFPFYQQPGDQGPVLPVRDPLIYNSLCDYFCHKWKCLAGCISRVSSPTSGTG